MNKNSEPPMAPLHPVDVWIAAHPDEFNRYRGKHVAIHPTFGIVASGDDLKSVWEAMERRGLLTEVSFDIVPKDI